MRIHCVFFLLLSFWLRGQQYTAAEIQRWKNQAEKVTIIRDQWGIPHIYGQTDADAVFGLMYAQGEDDYQRIEMNYLEKLGRLAEINGEKDVYNDLLNRIILDQDEAKKDYARSPKWLQTLLQAYSDGLNYYLYTHPEDKSLILHRYEPWWPLLWTDGSIGAISTGGLTIDELAQFYGGKNIQVSDASTVPDEQDPAGSNGFAIAPNLTTDRQSILYINPHVTFYFRPEVHVISQQGLNAYGAVTWGQFFVYQGFNDFCGWMHTSSEADVADVYLEKVRKDQDGRQYFYAGKWRPFQRKNIELAYKEGMSLKKKAFEIFYTHHGPVLAQRNGQWCSLKAQNRIMDGLIQSWQRTKATSFAKYEKTMTLQGNPSNNTVYADADGNIAYWHGNFMPRRNPIYDWSKPVDGTLKATEWQGMHKVKETVHSYNPVNGWLQNCNSTPFTVAGKNSPAKSAFPTYMAPDGENFRGINAVRLLTNQSGFDLDKIIATGYDRFLPAFQVLIPALLKAYTTRQTIYSPALSEVIAELSTWDFYAQANSISTTLAVEWGQKIWPAVMQSSASGDQVERAQRYVQSDRSDELLDALVATKQELIKWYGTWKIAWGEINRFQRISSNIGPTFDDDKPSIPVAMTSSLWGMLPSYTSRRFPNTTKRYGVNGNSFVCAVQFGTRIKAKSLLAGGQNGHEDSPHFSDQGLMYSQGQFKDVNFYEEDVKRNAVKTYRPGKQ